MLPVTMLCCIIHCQINTLNKYRVDWRVQTPPRGPQRMNPGDVGHHINTDWHWIRHRYSKCKSPDFSSYSTMWPFFILLFFKYPNYWMNCHEMCHRRSWFPGGWIKNNSDLFIDGQSLLQTWQRASRQKINWREANGTKALLKGTSNEVGFHLLF